MENEIQLGIIREEKTRAIQRDSGKDGAPPRRLGNYGELLFRLQNVEILDAHEGWFSGSSEIYFLSTVVADVSEAPLTKNSDIWSGVKDNHLVISEPGVKLYFQEGRFPRYLDLNLIFMKSNKSVRDFAAMFRSIESNQEYMGIANEIAGLINPTYQIIADIAQKLFGIVNTIMACTKDAQLIYVPQTFKLEEMAVGRWYFENSNVRGCLDFDFEE